MCTRLTLWVQMYSPYLESNVPFCSDLSLRVNLGPSSWIPTFLALRNMYLKTTKIILSVFTLVYNQSICSHCTANWHSIFWLYEAYYLVIFKFIPVKSEEDEVSLVVKGDHLSSTKLRVVGEQGSKHPSNGVTQSGGEVVQDHLWLVGGGSTVALCVCVCVCV